MNSDIALAPGERLIVRPGGEIGLRGNQLIILGIDLEFCESAAAVFPGKKGVQCFLIRKEKKWQPKF